MTDKGDALDSGDDVRLVRVPYPAELVREIDELVLAGRGGYRTRQEFLLDAAQNHLMEVKYGVTDDRHLLVSEPSVAPDGLRPKAASARATTKRGRPASGPSPAISNADAVKPVRALSDTELHPAARGPALENGLAVVRKEPLLGLHNRDYPSLWSAVQLAEETSVGPVSFTDFLDRVTERAWRYAESLRDLERQTNVKLRALFPTNPAKPQSAEEGFKSFAVGAIARTPRDDGKVDASGPLFSWGLCQLTREGSLLMAGLTTAGYKLLEDLDGISLRWPHEPEYGERFLDHLRQRASWDHAGFEQILAAVADRPTRVQLAHYFKRWRPDWSDAMANTNAAGFVARSREWGLVEPKLIDGVYALTEFGQATRAAAAARTSD